MNFFFLSRGFAQHCDQKLHAGEVYGVNYGEIKINAF